LLDFELRQIVHLLDQQRSIFSFWTSLTLFRPEVRGSSPKIGTSYITQKDTKSAKIGFRLYLDEGFGCSFYAPSDIIEKWVSYLQRQIHQKGFHERFKPIRILGKGNFATVYEVTRIEDGKKFAVKAFSKQNCFSTDKGK